MNTNLLKKVLEEEHNDVDAPVEIKNRVLRSIDNLLFYVNLLELYTSMPVVIIQGLAKKNGEGQEQIKN